MNDTSQSLRVDQRSPLSRSQLTNSAFQAVLSKAASLGVAANTPDPTAACIYGLAPLGLPVLAFFRAAEGALHNVDVFSYVWDDIHTSNDGHDVLCNCLPVILEGLRHVELPRCRETDGRDV